MAVNPQTFRRVLVLALLLLFVQASVAATLKPTIAPPLHTLRGGQDISRIHVTALYYLPPGRLPCPGWRERIGYVLDRLARFHEREFTGQSRVTWEISDTIFVPETRERPRDGNEWFWEAVSRVRKKSWQPDHSRGFPILVLFTNTNLCPGCDTEEWTRRCDPLTCVCQPHDPALCDGNVDAEGEDHPGSHCGGSRAVYWGAEQCGVAVLSGDAWRVPLKGSDCVAYHEAIGHAIGLPHPEPMNDSVMGRAQYRYSLSEAVLDEDQKRALGWQPRPVNRDDLFSRFRISYGPKRAMVGQPVTVTAHIPAKKSGRRIWAEYQTKFGEWTRLPEPTRRTEGSDERCEWTVPAFASPVFVSYRIFVEDGKAGVSQQWSLFRVNPEAPETPPAGAISPASGSP